MNEHISKKLDKSNYNIEIKSFENGDILRPTCVFSAKTHQSSFNISYTNGYIDYSIN